MRLSELIERLEELRDEFGDGLDPEVVCAYQPSWPLTGVLLGATTLQDDERVDHKGDYLPHDETSVVWLAIGGHPHGMSPYAPAGVFEEV